MAECSIFQRTSLDSPTTSISGSFSYMTIQHNHAPCTLGVSNDSAGSGSRLWRSLFPFFFLPAFSHLLQYIAVLRFFLIWSIQKHAPPRARQIAKVHQTTMSRNDDVSSSFLNYLQDHKIDPHSTLAACRAGALRCPRTSRSLHHARRRRVSILLFPLIINIALYFTSVTLNSSKFMP